MSSTISTRWLSFASWPLAICSGITLAALWRRGRWWRLAGIALLLFVGWWGMQTWLEAMVYYVRPREPF